ncbi:universal stress protein [Halalkalirubrum salinum]|uniref:universal stress protein n=1 Tax=Halalkalirubrum salinum TaxID=2563889 RepID=UPI0010FB2B2D|nr:universal stress protein [Halalkalirubrum salinum]
MTERLVLPIDGSEAAWDALAYAISAYSPREVHLLYVISGPTNHPYHGDGSIVEDEVFAAERRYAEELFETGRDRIDDSALDVTTAIRFGQPPHQIVKYADEHDCTAIVMGSTGRDGAARVLLGSVAETVARRASVPVTVVR